MRKIEVIKGIAAVTMLCAAVAPSFGAAPDLIEEPSAPEASAISGIDPYKLDIERIVRNWVLCVSQPLAETLVQARANGIEEAQKAYDQLAAQKACGRFGELRVVLKQSIYASATEAGYDARIFGAEVNLSGAWANAFVVSGAVQE